MKIEKLLPGNYYHIYNRGNNASNVFFEKANYFHFLKLFEKYIHPIADTFAWCLMKNHFHILLRLKEEDEIKTKDLMYSTIKEPKKIDVSRQFSHFFNAYTQAINKKYNRTGSLFEKPFERKQVTSEEYFKRLVYYIHTNPVHHGVTDKTKKYPWSSYHTMLSTKPTKLKRKEAIERFDSVDNFVFYHERDHDIEDMLGR